MSEPDFMCFTDEVNSSELQDMTHFNTNNPNLDQFQMPRFIASSVKFIYLIIKYVK